MKLPYQSIINQSLVSALGKLRDVEFPVATVYALKKLYDELETEHKTYRDLYRKIVEKNCLRDEKGQIVKNLRNPNAPAIDPEKVEAFKKSIIELNTLELELKSPVPVTAQEFPETLKLTLNEIEALEPLLNPKPAPSFKKKKS